MTNNNNQNVKKEKKDKSILKVVLTIFIALLLFWFVLSWGINVFKTTMTDDLQTEEVVKYNREVHRISDSPLNVYVGTTVPINDYIDTIYFNNNLGADYWYAKLESLSYLETQLIPTPIYPIAFSSDGSKVMLIVKIFNDSDNIYNYFLGIYNLNTMTSFYIIDVGLSSISINTDFLSGKSILFNDVFVSNYTYQFGMYSIGEYSGLPIGYSNEELKDLISITPFELNNNGSGNMNANPRYDYVYPQYEGELLLYSALDSDLGQNMCLSEILIDTTLTYENYTYTYSSDIYVTIDGGIVQYNLDNVYSTQNINDLYYISYVVANLVYSVDDHGVYINVVYYVNNNTTYNFSDFEDCEVNYDVSYQLGANGVTSTIDTTRALVDYYSSQAYNNGKNVGYDEGYDLGYNLGFNDGLNNEDNNSQYWQNGYNQGYDFGYSKGLEDELNNKTNYDKGYDAGMTDKAVPNLMNTILNAPYTLFKGILNFEFMGINLFSLFSFIFTTFLIGGILKKIIFK